MLEIWTAWRDAEIRMGYVLFGILPVICSGKAEISSCTPRFRDAANQDILGRLRFKGENAP